MGKPRPDWKQVVNSWNYRISAIIIGAAVTVLFWSNFSHASGSFLDLAIYWAIYGGCMVFLLYAIYVVVRRQL